MAIFTAMGVEVKVVGGPYRRFPSNLLDYYETVMVCSVKGPTFRIERPIGELRADGGIHEILDAIGRLNKD